MKSKLLFLVYALVLVFTTGTAQEIRVHSHNDYMQNVPFWNALAAQATSIEVDVFLSNGKLLVGHELYELNEQKTIERLYLEPLKESIARGYVENSTLQLLVDIKTDALTTLNAIVTTLKGYPTIINTKNITITISGNRPPPAAFVNYPEYISFDYQSLAPINDAKVLKKISMVSLSFAQFSEWNGKGRLTAKDYTTVAGVIAKAHALHKPFRFWATPDSKSAWKAFVDMGVDFINTDMPNACVSYVTTLKERVVQNSVFSEVYRPTFVSDQQPKKPKNVILLIGDGNGLTQISSATLANGGELSLTQLKSIGFIKTQSADDFTTDSAAAGTAIATGQKTNNRAIGTDKNGVALPSITEILSTNNFSTGVITTDGIAGATPSSFYAHRTDRGMVDGIAADLNKNTLQLFIGQKEDAVKGIEDVGFKMISNIGAIGKSTHNKVGAWLDYGKNIPLKEHVEKLATATTNGIAFLNAKQKPFFLMVEGAKIDSYGHENNISGVIAESISFDKAITQALQFADADKNTLVIITADHETGGLTIPQGNLEKHEIEADFTTHDHTAMMVPIFAYGPMSQEFQGVYENNEVFYKIMNVLGL